jgi:hypothetical protein
MVVSPDGKVAFEPARLLLIYPLQLVKEQGIRVEHTSIDVNDLVFDFEKYIKTGLQGMGTGWNWRFWSLMPPGGFKGTRLSSRNLATTPLDVINAWWSLITSDIRPGRRWDLLGDL